MVILIIAINYTVEYDEARKVYRIRNKDAPYCPDCGQLLSGYDTRARHVVDSSGQICWYRLRRLKCLCCDKLHLELPDFMAPKKHYEARLIKMLWLADQILARLMIRRSEDGKKENTHPVCLNWFCAA